MRHGFSDEMAVDVTADDLRRFATDSVRRLADMLDPAWLADQQKLAPAKWRVNAAFSVSQQIDIARADLNAGSVSDADRQAGFAVIRAAKDLLAKIG